MADEEEKKRRDYDDPKRDRGEDSPDKDKKQSGNEDEKDYPSRKPAKTPDIGDDPDEIRRHTPKLK